MIDFKKYGNVGHGNLEPASSPDKPYSKPLQKREGEAFKQGGTAMKKSIDRGTARGLSRGESSGMESGRIAKDLAKGRPTGRMSGYSPAHGLSTGKATGQMKEGRRCHQEGGEVEREYTAKARRMDDDAKPGMKRGGHARHRDMGGALPSNAAPMLNGMKSSPGAVPLKNAYLRKPMQNAAAPMQNARAPMPLKHGGHAKHAECTEHHEERRKHRSGGGSMEGSMKKIFEGGMKASNPAKEDYMKKLHATTRMVSQGIPHAENLRQHPSGRRGR